MIRIQLVNNFIRKHCKRLSGLVLVLFFIAAQWITPAYSATEKKEKSGDFIRGSIAWANNCARCHNFRNAAELRDDQWKVAVSHMRVRAGLTGQQARDILRFLQESNSKFIPAEPIWSQSTAAETESIALDLEKGKSIFETTCFACHGKDGRGTIPGVPDFTRKNSSLDKTDAILIKNIWEGYQSPGSPLAMPPKGGNPSLTQEDIRKLLVYIRREFGAGAKK